MKVEQCTNKVISGERAMSKERGILFSGDMVRAIQAKRKTQTRRIIKLPSDVIWRFTDIMADGSYRFEHYGREKLIDGLSFRKCPYGQAGDRLYVRETWKPTRSQITPNSYVRYGADDSRRRVVHNLEGNGSDRWRPSIFMPKWVARIWLEITNIRVERLRDINEEDAIAEGLDTDGACLCKEFDGVRFCIHCNKRLWDFVGEFRGLWDSINAKRGYGWDKNPWIWVIEFKELVKDGREAM